MMTVGGWGAAESRWPLPPSSSTSSSWTTLTTCWAGVSDLSTSWPTALSRTRSRKPRTTLKLTSASSSATRTSRSASWMLSSVSRPRLPRRSKMDCSRVPRDSSMERTKFYATTRNISTHCLEPDAAPDVTSRRGPGRSGVRGGAHLLDHGGRVGRLEHRRAGDEDGGAAPGQGAGVLDLHAPVDGDVHGPAGQQGTDLADLRVDTRD